MSQPAGASRATRPDASAASTRPLRVAFLTNFVSPYRRPVFEELHQTPGWCFRVFTNADTEFDRNWTVDTSRLDVKRSRNWEIKRQIHHEQPITFTQEVTLHVPYGLFSDLWSFRPDVIVSTELGPRSLIAMTYAKLRRTPLLL